MIEARPKSIAEVASRTLDGNVFNMELADFLDEFYLKPSAESLAQKPVRLQGRLENGHRKDVYLAAVAEHLARQFHLRLSDWVFADDLYLKTPVFAWQSKAGRSYLLRDSPPAFKSRNLFVTPNVLTRV